MSSETREFRPYRVDPRLQAALDGTSMRFGDLVVANRGSVLIEDRTFSRRPASVVWAGEDGFEQFKRDLCGGSVDSGFDPSLLVLVVAVRSGYLKTQELAVEVALSDLDQLDRVTSITSDPNGSRRTAFRTDTHGASVEVFVALNRQLEPKPLAAWRKATWLAKATFRIRCDVDTTLFRPMPLDRAKRDELNRRDNVTWYNDTTFFVEFDSGCDLTADLSDTEVPYLWVDEELLTMLDQHRTSPVAELIQTQMVLHLISNVIYEFSRRASGEGSEGADVELDTRTYQDLSGSLVGRIARLIAGPKATQAQRSDVIDKMRTDPVVAVAWAETKARLRSSLIDSLVPKT